MVRRAVKGLAVAAAVIGFAAVLAAVATAQTLAWSSDTVRADGTPLTNLAGYRLYQSTHSLLAASTQQATADPLVLRTDVAAPTTTYTLLSALPANATTYFRLTAFDSTGLESGFNVDATTLLDVEVSSYVPPTPIPGVNACGVLNQPGATYVLQKDVAANDTCFSVQAPNITLDLNGHTVLYDDLAIPAVSNGSFELGSGASPASWDLSQAPNAARIQGTIVQPVQVSTGSFSLAVTVPSSNELMLNTAPLALASGHNYVASVMVYDMTSNSASSNSKFIEILDASSGVVLSSHSMTGNTVRGFGYLYAFYRPAAAVNVKIAIGLGNAASSAAGAVYFDDVRLTTSRNYGIVGAACWDTADEVPLYGTPCGGPSTGFIVKNGVVTQGAGGGRLGDAFAFLQGGPDNFQVLNTTSAVYGPSAHNIEAQYEKGATIAGNVFYNAVTIDADRDNFDGSVLLISGGAGGHTISNNILRGGCQIGMALLGSASYAATDAPSVVSGNDISQDGTYTNDVAIMLYGANNYDVSNNFIHPNSGRGLFIAFATNDQVHDNVLQVRELPRNQEYNGCQASGAYGIELRSSHNSRVRNNSITSYADQCEARGIGLRTDPPNQIANTLVDQNTVNAVRVGQTTQMASDVEYEGVDGGVTLTSNTFIADGANLWDYWGGGFNVTMASDTFSQGSNPASDYATFRWKVGGSNSTGTVVLDGNFVNGASSQSISMLPIGYAGWGTATDLTISWTLHLTVLGLSGNPAPGASVTIHDAAGAVAFSGAVDSSGRADIPLKTAYSSNTLTAPVVTQAFTPHQISVSLTGAGSASGSVTMTRPTWLTVVLGTIDTIPPVVAISSPRAGGYVPASTTLAATAADDVVVASVTFQLDGNDLGFRLTAPPYSVVWDNSAVPQGPHTLTAMAWDLTGNQGVSAPVSIIVDHTPPFVALTTPVAGGIVGGLAAIGGTAGDSLKFASLQFFLDGQPFGPVFSTGPFIVAWDTTLVRNGTHTITAIAYDAAGNSAAASEGVLVRNPHAALRLVLAPDAVQVGAAAAHAFISLWVDDPLFPYASAVSAQVVLPSGMRTFTLSQLATDPMVLFAKVLASTFSPADWAGVDRSTLAVAVGTGTWGALGDVHTIEPTLGGVIGETTGGTQVVIQPGQITQEATINIQPESTASSIGRQSAAQQQSLNEFSPGREIVMQTSGTMSGATLFMPYDVTQIPAGRTVNDVRLGYYNPTTGLWELIMPQSTSGGVILAAVPHFSLYAPVILMPDASPGLRTAYVYPNPAADGQEPTIRASVGVVQSLDITVFDVAGRVVHSATITGAPTGILNNQYYYDYAWSSAKASGVYYAVLRGKASDGSIVRARARFAVVR